MQLKQFERVPCNQGIGDAEVVTPARLGKAACVSDFANYGTAIQSTRPPRYIRIQINCDSGSDLRR